MFIQNELDATDKEIATSVIVGIVFNAVFYGILIGGAMLIARCVGA